MFFVEIIDLIVLILASFRLTHLIVFDQITSFIREPFMIVKTKENDAGELEEYVEIKGNGLRSLIGTILSCYWCAGIWCSVLVVILYFFVPLMYPLLLILAIAGAAAFLESKIL